MNYERLKTFLTVADQQSFSEAARILYLSQPTITAHIKALESQLQTALFERTTKSVQLTHAGKVYYTYAKEIVQLFERAEKEVRSLAKTIHGELELACSLTIGENVLPNLLGKFKEKYPLVQLQVEITNTTQIAAKIKAHTLDIGLIEAPVQDPELVLEPFLQDELVLIAKPGYLAEGTEKVTIEQLLELPLVLREKGSGTRAVMEHYLQQVINLAKLDIAFELGSTEAVKTAVEAGLGVSIISKHAITKELQLGLLQAYPLEHIRLTRNFFIVYKQDAVLKTAVDAFLQLIRTTSKT